MADFGTDSWIHWALLAGCAAGLVSLLAGIIQLVRPGIRVASLAAAGAGLLLLSGSLFLLTVPSQASLGLFDAMLALPPLLAAGGIVARLKTVSASLGGRGAAVVLLASGTIMVGLFGVRLEQRQELRVAPLSLSEYDAEHIRQLLPRGAIQTAPADPTYNCHDFAFFAGPNASPYTTVKELLQAGSYAPVATPQPGDVIVYYGPEASPLHSGRVKAVGKDGFVLVESKWGQLGRYLHEAAIPDFAVGYAFYRQGADSADGAVANQEFPPRARSTHLRRPNRMGAGIGS